MVHAAKRKWNGEDWGPADDATHPVEGAARRISSSAVRSKEIVVQSPNGPAAHRQARSNRRLCSRWFSRVLSDEAADLSFMGA